MEKNCERRAAGLFGVSRDWTSLKIIDAQVTDAPGATEETIRAEVRRAIDTLGKGGGLMASSSVMFSVVPKVDGIIDDAGKKYGQYKNLHWD